MIRISSLAARRLLDRGVAKADAAYPTAEEIAADPVETKLKQVVQALLMTKSQVETVGAKVDSLVAKSSVPSPPVKYKFTVIRSKDGLIETITTEPI